MEGYNLFTLSSLIKYNIDPESPAVNNGLSPAKNLYDEVKVNILKRKNMKKIISLFVLSFMISSCILIIGWMV